MNDNIIFRNGTPLDQPAVPVFRPYPGFRPGITREDALIVERDVEVPMRDGICIYVDIIRPAETSTVVPALVAWSPYGKHGMTSFLMLPEAAVSDDELSPYTAFEAPDPARWAQYGYAVVNVDPRGAWKSAGDMRFWGREEARDAHDLIEWLATQPWSNTKIGMCGVSYLGAIQWFTAAERPPHLAAIHVHQGFSDVYRDVFFHGGIQETRFAPALQNVFANYSETRVEDLAAMSAEHPLFDEYWANKAADFERITVPAYVVAGWQAQGIHLRGTVEGFTRINSSEKWLEDSRGQGVALLLRRTQHQSPTSLLRPLSERYWLP